MRMAILQGTECNKCRWRCQEAGVLVCCEWGVKLQIPYMMIFHYGKQFFEELNIESPYNPATPLLDIYSRYSKAETQIL